MAGSISQASARSIIPPNNFLGVEEWKAFYGINFSKKQLRAVEEFPYSKDVLNAPCGFHKGKSVKETHFAFLGLDAFKGNPLTILKWQKIHPASGHPRFYSYAPDSWYSEKLFARELTCSFRWYLMPVEILPGSAGKIHSKQIDMLPADYEVPWAIEEVSKNILYYRKNGAYPNPTKWGRCQDRVTDGYRVDVGYSELEGLNIGYHWDGIPLDSIGLAVSRKL